MKKRRAAEIAAGRRAAGSSPPRSGLASPRGAFFNNERSPFFQSFRPALRERHEDVRAAWNDAASRAIHFIQNSGFIAGVVDTSESCIVGPGLRLSARPSDTLLGWDAKDALEWGTLAEAVFNDWANKPVHCDAAGRSTFGQMCQAAYRSYFAYGEIVALYPTIEDGSPWQTKIRLLPPSRLKNDTDIHRNLVQGVRMNGFGRPVSYLFRSASAVPETLLREVELPAFDTLGRPVVHHVFDPDVSAIRGISPLAPALKVARQLDQLCDATLTTALIQTIFAASLKTNVSGASAFDGLFSEEDIGEKVASFGSARGDWYDGAKIDFTQHGRVAHLFPGDELNFHASQHPGPQFDHFMRWLLREIAKCAGVTYESATGDYSGATYSSVRMGGAMEWLTVTKRRSNTVAPIAQAAYEFVIDEAIYTGRLPYPGGYEAFSNQRTATCLARWHGPARPQADDFKTAKAHQVLLEMGITTLEIVSAEYGIDWDQGMRQRARENAFAKENGLPEPHRDKDAPVVPLTKEQEEEMLQEEEG